MPITNPYEIFSIFVLIAAVAYIFSGILPRKDPFRTKPTWEDIKFAAMVAAPAVLVHEMFHKFTAMAFGLPAFFQVSWFGIGLAVFLKLISAPFLIIAPGFVSMPATLPLPSVLIAFAGPFANLVMWLGSALLLKKMRVIRRKTVMLLLLSRQINKYLFIFNMIPIPGFDGFHVVSGLWHLIA
ncbi:MAG TPA: M50 family metallopeptidase [Nanoarchaeota archaeon]|nr:M50 family metallopeptidase [Nanoarchaeota archaeon]